MAETWIINNFINNNSGVYSLNTQINFGIYGLSSGFVYFEYTEDIDFETLMPLIKIIYWETPSLSSTIVVYQDGHWTGQAYRTVTFETSPTGDLLTWLQANAVKQSSITDLTGYTWIGNETLDYGQNDLSLRNLDFDFNYITENNATSYSTYEHANSFSIVIGFDFEDTSLNFGVLRSIRYSFPRNEVYSNNLWRSRTGTGLSNFFVTTDQETLLAMRTIKFNGGTDATNTDLIKWLQDNGTLILTYITLDLSTIGLHAGSHSIQMSLSDNGLTKVDSELSNSAIYEQYEQLATPVITLTDSVLTWPSIAYASSYALYVDNTNKGSVTSGVDLDTLQIGAGRHNVQLKAIGSDYYTDSNLSNTITYDNRLQLDTPTSLTASDTTISFDTVENAENYEVFADGESIGEYATISKEVWLLNEQPTAPENVLSSLFVNNNIEFDVIYFNNSTNKLQYIQESEMAPLTVYDFGTHTWIEQSYRTINVLDEASGNFYSWLQNNATKIGG